MLPAFRVEVGDGEVTQGGPGVKTDKVQNEQQNQRVNVSPPNQEPGLLTLHSPGKSPFTQLYQAAASLLLSLLRWAMGTLPVSLAAVFGRGLGSEQWLGRGCWGRDLCQDVARSDPLPSFTLCSLGGTGGTWPFKAASCRSGLPSLPAPGKERFAFI